MSGFSASCTRNPPQSQSLKIRTSTRRKRRSAIPVQHGIDDPASEKVTEMFLLLVLIGLEDSNMEAMRTEQNSLGFLEASSNKLWGDANNQMEMCSTIAQDVYEIRPRKAQDGVDLISDRLRRGPIWYAGPDAVRNAVSFAKYRSRSRSRWAIIRVFNEAGNVTETYEY
jgi:hypothetical protein